MDSVDLDGGATELRLAACLTFATTVWRNAIARISVAALTLVLAAPTSAQASAAERPSTAIRAAHFEEPLVPTTASTAAQDQALVLALDQYSRRNDPDDFSALDAYLAANPASPWNMAILTNKGLRDLHQGYYSRALDDWKRAWAAGKNASDPQARALTDRAIGELASLYAGLGMNTELTALFKDIGHRPVSGPATEAVQTAREELTISNRKKIMSHLFNCGPLALLSLMKAEGFTPQQVDFLHWYRPGAKGTSFAEIGRLADKARFAYRIVYRKPGEAVPVPSVVHWKVGHYAAIVGQANGKYHVIDSVFPSGDAWFSQTAIDSETSGYFLIPAAAHSAWRAVPLSEAAKVWGRGGTSGITKGSAGALDPKANSPDGGPGSGGNSANGNGPYGANGPNGPNGPRGPKPNGPCPLCIYNIGESTVSLSLSDVPVGYAPPIGPSAKVQITYNQREDSQPATFSFFNVSPKWTLNFLSYVIDDPTNPGASVGRYLAGGGEYYYTGYQSSTGQFSAQSNDGSILTLVSQSPVSYRRQLGDGSIEIYSQSDGAISYPRHVFLSQIIDPQGNTLTLNYDTQLRLTSIADATGRQTTFSYGLSAHPFLITQITDPFGRSANLTYDSNGRLSSITDIIGLTSSFAYDSNSLVNSMTTPYGTTTFAYTAPGTSGPPRFLQITDPMGFHEREEWLEPAPVPFSDPSGTVPTGMPLSPFNQYLYDRDSFHWDKNAYVAAGCTPTGGCDYSMARDRHFAHDAANASLKSTTIESMKYALEHRIWYNYPGQTSSLYSGTGTQPIAIGRVLDDGSTQLSKATYDTAGFYKLTSQTDPLGRTTTYSYPNHIDLTQVSQTVSGGTQQTLAQFTYNSQHRPLTYTDAAGQTRNYTYNAAGQVTSATNPLNQQTGYQYNTTGDLAEIINANNQTAETFTYDSYDRVRTATDSEDYVLTYDYDAANRITKITYPDGTTDSYTYDKLDLASYTDRLGRRWTYTHDADGRLTVTTDPMGHQTQFGYNHDGALTSLTDPKNNVTQWAYDIEGRLISKTYPDNSAVAYTYETTTSRLKSVLDALNQTKQYAYAEDDRLTGIIYLNAVNLTPNVTFAYDPYFPRMTAMTDGTGTTQFTYVPAGSLGALQIQRQSGPIAGNTIDFEYDEVGRIESRTVAGESAEVFGYDAIGRLTSHNSDLGDFALSYLGQTDQTTSRQLAGSTLETSWSYLPNSGDRRLAGINNTGLSTSQYSNYTFTTTPYTITDTTEVNDSGSVYPTSYSQTASYNDLNQLTDLSGLSLTFDKNGNLLSDGERTYSWDAENRLISITYPTRPGKQTTFTYNALSQRVTVVSTPAGGGTSVTTSYIWCGSAPCQARDGTNAPTHEYFAEGEFVPGTPGQAYYYGVDQIRSVHRVFVNASSAPSYGYDPYGNALQATALITDFGYAGLLYNTDSGLYLSAHRAYDPVAGRWMSRDPIGEGNNADNNLYLYVAGNPISDIDPLGLCGQPKNGPCDIDEGLNKLGEELATVGGSATRGAALVGLLGGGNPVTDAYALTAGTAGLLLVGAGATVMEAAGNQGGVVSTALAALAGEALPDPSNLSPNDPAQDAADKTAKYLNPCP